MTVFKKISVLTLAIAMIGGSTDAFAQQRHSTYTSTYNYNYNYNGGGYGYRGYGGYYGGCGGCVSGGAAAAIGIGSLATGILLGSVIANQNNRPPQQVIVQQPVYVAPPQGLECVDIPQTDQRGYTITKRYCR